MPCYPEPPFPLPTSAISEDTASALGLLDALNTQMEGGCVCDDEEYVAPVCCEDCDDVILDKTFTLSGIASPYAAYNGTWNLVKGDGLCDGVDCCWYGVQGIYTAVLTHSAGTWNLSIDGGVAIYELVENVCLTPLGMSKTSGPDEFPGSVTVNG